MAREGLVAVVLDTSVLINFLKLDRADLLGNHARFSFLVTEHVRNEITKRYSDQLNRLEASIQNGWLLETIVDQLPELQSFAFLADSNRLGRGECAAIAVAHHRGLRIAVDDKRASKTAKTMLPEGAVLDTVLVVVSLIESGAITVKEADTMKEIWETQYRFRLTFKTFQDKLAR